MAVSLRPLLCGWDHVTGKREATPSTHTKGTQLRRLQSHGTIHIPQSLGPKGTPQDPTIPLPQWLLYDACPRACQCTVCRASVGHRDRDGGVLPSTVCVHWACSEFPTVLVSSRSHYRSTHYMENINIHTLPQKHVWTTHVT